ncbi:PvdJ/PvdD/PvdP-like protein [Pseudomonas sp. RP23018S]|uniref:pyoverdine maturation tyrosinase PvdP n=1 Tax=Pseudomonas sp. RP23018S TaxID=3096037 RepID=UPI002ACAC9A1|nr:PvdJ/PvdD/PvdP-like protein [Pseudomonas sp. RP23018S]MDZ5601676.1 PvdJ/PvdD/PvdP-like protein [Pseudomonas sp. RP23018S]
MTLSRRGFMAVAALLGAAVPAGYYGHRELTRPEEAPETPGEATVDLTDGAGQHLANRLRGIWSVRMHGAEAGLPGLSGDDLELFIDIAARGRGVRGCLDSAARLRSEAQPAYGLVGDLRQDNDGRLYWRLVAAHATAPRYEMSVQVDEVWDAFGNAGRDTFTGRLIDLERPLALPQRDTLFVATKHAFPEARQRITLQPPLLAWLISAEHRLFHQLWHASRDRWHTLPDDKRNALRGLGWQPGPRDSERDARGRHKDRNGSGVDFFFMHRHMLASARALQPLPSWPHFPLPQPALERDRQGFAAYFDNLDGCSIPPTWLADDDEEYTEWVSGIKREETFQANFALWESQYRDPRYLSQMTLGQLGSEMELGLHDWLHMRWAAVPRDPSNGAPVPYGRTQDDFAPRWFRAENDFLGDPFSSHVHPVFWRFHGWIDDRIEDWFAAQERFHPGEVRRLDVNGVPWFAPGRWVEVDDPWLGPDTHGCSTVPGVRPGRSVEMDVETMKLALRIIWAGEDDGIKGLLKRVPKRPWYARHLSVAGMDF